VALLVVFLVRLVLSFLEESSLRGDAALAPSLSTAPEVVPANVAEAMRRSMRQHDCVEVADSMRVVVGRSDASRPMKVVGSGTGISSNAPSQAIDVSFRCRRRGPFFFEKEVTVELRTAAIGDGQGGVYPAPPH
jgi:hypothetical protein